MQVTHSLLGAAVLALLTAPAASAQGADSTADTPLIVASAAAADTGDARTADAPKVESAAEPSTAAPIEIQHMRPQDARGINVFEAPKAEGVPFKGFKLSWGAAFAQQFQSLSHTNTAAPNLVEITGTNGQPSTVDQNELMKVGKGFNNATANLYLNAQLAEGIRVALTTYLSSRHHNETWVKDGYLLIDDTPIAHPLLERVMQYVTVKAGHFEVNYGDAHFRRTDNGNAMQNPFVGNLLLDGFTTEVGGEVYVRTGPWLAMAGMTGGEIKGNVTSPGDRSPAYLGKLGYDRELSKDLRVRLTGSAYRNAKSPSNTLYSGDRAGSRYYYVMENTQATADKQFTSGLVNPGFRYEVTAFQVNPFVKIRGLELFGVAERAEGRGKAEVEDRTWTQYAGDALYRFADERLYVGGRYNVVKGELAGIQAKVGADRVQLGAGWFITPSILLKGEWVTQSYNDFPTTDIRNGGQFDGFVMEGVVSF